MRSVSSAIWTLVLPVSRSPAPNCSAISRLRSLVMLHRRDGSRPPLRGQRARRPPSLPAAASAPAPRQLARALDVAAHLLHQRGGVGEAPLAAQPREEVQAQLAAVEVAVEVEDVGLDQLAAAGVEGRAHADADRGGAGRAVVAARHA